MHPWEKPSAHDRSRTFHLPIMGGFHVTSSPQCWWTKTKDPSLTSFVRQPGVVQFCIVIGVSREWLKTPYYCSSYALSLGYTKNLRAGVIRLADIFVLHTATVEMSSQKVAFSQFFGSDGKWSCFKPTIIS